jgi:hypothetical protein
MRTTTTILSAAIALALGGCCMGGGTATPATPLPPGTPGTAVAPTAGGPMVALAPGFAPDPMVLSGTAGGPVDASTNGPLCRGWIAAAPNHILNVTAPFTSLRVTASSSIDTTMVIRLSDGRVLCNDDFEMTNPGLVDAFPVGQHQVWIGSYSMGGTAPYTLNISAAAAAVPPLGGILPAIGLGAAFPGVPTHCGMTVPDYGPIRIGTSVVLGSHTGWSGPDGRGGYVTEDTWWNDAMWAHVGQRTTITELAGLDPVGCPYVRTAIDGGSWGWRTRNLSP